MGNFCAYEVVVVVVVVAVIISFWTLKNAQNFVVLNKYTKKLSPCWHIPKFLFFFSMPLSDKSLAGKHDLGRGVHVFKLYH